MHADLLVARVEAARRYFAFLEKTRDMTWAALHEMYRRRELEPPEAMALVHPRYYEELGRAAESVRGPRGFEKFGAITGRRCEAERIWGYLCPSLGTEPLCADHQFPYSLGGPTVAQNIRYLCQAHNRMKSTDIHFYPWEAGAPQWLPDAVGRVHRLLLRP